VQALHQGQPSRQRPAPAGVVLVAGPEAGSGEAPDWFLAGTEPRHHGANSQVTRTAAPGFGIRSPVDGSVFALDPDIPPRQQRIVFEGVAGQWWLGGKLLGRSTPAQPLSWAPWPGRHKLELRDEKSQQVLASVGFEVRGAVVRAGARR
jgi:penicillin-binding protein 1C